MKKLLKVSQCKLNWLISILISIVQIETLKKIIILVAKVEGLEHQVYVGGGRLEGLKMTIS